MSEPGENTTLTEAPFHELSQKDRVAQCLEAVYKVAPDAARHILEVEQEHKARDGNNWEEKTLTEQVTPEEAAQAREVLVTEQEQKQAEFEAKLNALCQEYGATLQIQQNVVAVFNAA